MNGRQLYMGAFLLSIVTISYWSFRKCHELPWPPQFIYTGLVFALLHLFSLLNEEIAGVTAIGFVLATFLKKGWVADCAHGAKGTASVQTTSFIGGSTPGSQQFSAPPPYTIASQ